MVNPQEQGTYDYWITDRIPFHVVKPKSGSTGDLDKWITDRLHFVEYAAVTIIVGETVWGHDTAVLETNVRDFTGNWTGTGEIINDGLGDSERIELGAGELMTSETVNTGSKVVQLLLNNYAAGDAVTLEYRHGATQAACESAGWNAYVGTFTSLGYVQIRITSTV